MRTAYIDLVGFRYTSQTYRFFTIPAAIRKGRYALPGLSSRATDSHYLNNIKSINYTRRKEGMDAFLLVVVISLVSLPFVATMLFTMRARKKTTVNQLAFCGPSYTYNVKHADYYRRSTNTNEAGDTHKDKEQRGSDLRDRPLPKCPQWGTAVGFGEPKCVKCGHALRTL